MPKPTTGTEITDLQLLRRLLGAGALSASQQKAFQGMLQDLVDGRQIGLSKAQRNWAMQLFNDQDLAHKPSTMVRLPVPRKAWDAPPTVWDLPKPLKPPGRGGP